jgi:hypothetical protein
VVIRDGVAEGTDEPFHFSLADSGSHSVSVAIRAYPKILEVLRAFCNKAGNF